MHDTRRDRLHNQPLCGMEGYHLQHMRRIITCMQTTDVLVRSRLSRLMANTQGPLVYCTVFRSSRDGARDEAISSSYFPSSSSSTCKPSGVSCGQHLSTSSFEHGLGCLRASLYFRLTKFCNACSNNKDQITTVGYFAWSLSWSGTLPAATGVCNKKAPEVKWQVTMPL